MQKIQIPQKSKQELESEARIQKRDNARVFKWKEMLVNYPQSLHTKLKPRGRKGIPDSIRGFAWHLLTDRNSSKVMEKDNVEKLMINLMN
jgi:hypothetical protein